MRIALSDDPYWDQASSARVLLDDYSGGPCGAPACSDDEDAATSPADPGWQLTVRQRERGARDADGTALYEWVTAWEGRAIRATTSTRYALNRGRTETSDATGQSLETTTAVLAGAFDVPITETAVAFDDLGQRWEITGVDAAADGTHLSLQRVVDVDG